jgi:hypothetical protein
MIPFGVTVLVLDGPASKSAGQLTAAAETDEEVDVGVGAELDVGAGEGGLDSSLEACPTQPVTSQSFEAGLIAGGEEAARSSNADGSSVTTAPPPHAATVATETRRLLQERKRSVRRRMRVLR